MDNMTKEAIEALGFTETSPNRFAIRAAQTTLILAFNALHIAGSKLVDVECPNHLEQLVKCMKLTKL